MTISPSSTNFSALVIESACTNSGKYLVKGFPDFETSSTRFPSRKATQRKPSHLGSYCHSVPTGSSLAGCASIGLYRLFNGRVIRIPYGSNGQDAASLYVVITRPITSNSKTPIHTPRV